MDKVQELHLELLKTIKYKNISGEKIVADLLAHQELWHAVYVEFKWHIDVDEAPSHFWDPWHIYIFTIPGKEYELRYLAKTWDPTDTRFTCEHDHWKPTDEEPFYTNDQVILDNKKLYLSLRWDDVIYPTSGDHNQFPLTSMEDKLK
jgi:hypothetical protein